MEEEFEPLTRMRDVADAAVGLSLAKSALKVVKANIGWYTTREYDDALKGAVLGIAEAKVLYDNAYRRYTNPHNTPKGIYPDGTLVYGYA